MNTKNPNGWPFGSFQTIWKQKRGPWPGENHLGPFLHHIHWPTAPTIALAGKQFNLPAEFLANFKRSDAWECVCVFGVQMISKGTEKPIEQPSKATPQ